MSEMKYRVVQLCELRISNFTPGRVAGPISHAMPARHFDVCPHQSQDRRTGVGPGVAIVQSGQTSYNCGSLWRPRQPI